MLVIDPALAYTDNIVENEADNTKYIVTTHLSKEELIAGIPSLQGKEDRVYVVDCVQISLDTIGRNNFV